MAGRGDAGARRHAPIYLCSKLLVYVVGRGSKYSHIFLPSEKLPHSAYPWPGRPLVFQRAFRPPKDPSRSGAASVTFYSPGTSGHFPAPA